MPSSYKLIYFDIRCLGEVSRQLLFLAEQPFEDVRYTFEEWPEHKHETPFRQVPVLEVDGKQLPQSFAIARYLARKYGFAGKVDFEAAWVDAIADQCKDYFFELQPNLAVVVGVRPGDKETAETNVKAAGLKIFPFLEARLSESASSSGFLVGDSLTWIDLFVADHVDVMNGLFPGFLDVYPKTLAHSVKVNAEPKLKAYLDKRPARSF